MDQVISAARTLGKQLQADERYTRYIQAQEANNQDAALQEMIERFNLMRVELNTEVSKTEKDQERIKELDAEVKSVYRDIFANRNMIAFTEARGELETLIGFVNQIVTGSSNGEDPETIEYTASCGGSCSSCAGCH
ncbi:MAG: YlbF family regulator [Oscillospiraceae bacterium]|jgi:cell fate (sporulation/competence/biofilm development) regulator YlbF (YheA/YmcA/DUF963 family)|nr:YlbF family regulator [Oscillospiraceae bacterium]